MAAMSCMQFLVIKRFEAIDRESLRWKHWFSDGIYVL